MKASEDFGTSASRTASADVAAVSRRRFMQTLGAGLLIAVSGVGAVAQESGFTAGGARRGGRGGGGRGGGGPRTVAARLHIGADGIVTVMSGKVEGGQGSRAEIAMAAAEELGATLDQVRVMLCDTQLTPDDGPTYGSATTPNTVPSVRAGAAAGREILTALACAKWNAQRADVDVAGGFVVHRDGSKKISFGDLVGSDSDKVFAAAIPAGISVTPVSKWKTMGTPVLRYDRRDLVTGAHLYPSDIVRPGMLYGAVLRPPGYGSTLKSIDLSAVNGKADFPGVVATREGDFVAVAAPKSALAQAAIDALSKTAQWTEPNSISSADLYDTLLKNVSGGPPVNPFAAAAASSVKHLRQTYHVAYAQHAPLEPRAAVAEWADGKLTVWTGTQDPFGVRLELMQAFNLPADSTRVIVPDFGGGFGGKHRGNAAIEAARIAKAAGKPVWLCWTREEEFTWAYFRPSSVILAEAGLDAAGKLANWWFASINPGPSGVNSPYSVASNRSESLQTAAPLAQGSYRGLAITANNFARESFMDEMADLAGKNPLEFRLAHLEDARMRAVVTAAAEQFGFADRWAKKQPSVGVGMACGTEKNSYLATCVEVKVGSSRAITVTEICQVYECGKIVNPAGLMQQVQGAIVMGLGPALREEIRFEKGRITNSNFADYGPPRFADLPAKMDVQLLDRPDLPSAGAGETAIMAIAPAIANAVFHATGIRVRQMPVRLPMA